MTRSLYQVPNFELLTHIATSRVQGRKETKCRDWCLKNQKIKEGQPKLLNSIVDGGLSANQLEQTFTPVFFSQLQCYKSVN